MKGPGVQTLHVKLISQATVPYRGGQTEEGRVEGRRREETEQRDERGSADERRKLRKQA